MPNLKEQLRQATGEIRRFEDLGERRLTGAGLDESMGEPETQNPVIDLRHQNIFNFWDDDEFDERFGMIGIHPRLIRIDRTINLFRNERLDYSI